MSVKIKFKDPERDEITEILGPYEWELEPIATVEYTEEDLAWFRKPVTEVA